MTEVPKPRDSGVSGTQEVGADNTTALQVIPPMQSVTMTQAIEGLAASRPRSLGGDVSAAFIAAAMSQMSQELQATRGSLREKEERLQVLSDELTQVKVRNASLTSHLGVAGKTQRLRQFSIFAGTAILGISVDLFKNENMSLALLTAAIGIGLLVFGWLSPAIGGGE